MNLNMSRIVSDNARKIPDKTAIIFEDRRISYVELDRLINRMASGLLASGLRQGDVVSLYLPSLPELIIAYLGTVRAGLTVNVVNAMLRKQEVAYILNDCASRAVIVDAGREPIIEEVKGDLENLDTKIV
ncbi:MAG: long-chain fatty acid--CoA ligase, partial [Proteobacteria bacterium]|nr:long-chain fatty acid--CoA ligase [Pseudomonadota bacterium]